MSSEGGAPQPPKTTGFVSSFINKGAGSKKFAPKAAARRRPGAAVQPAKLTTPAPATPPFEPPATSTPTIGTPAPESHPAPKPALPTPAATQDAPQDLAERDTSNEIPVAPAVVEVESTIQTAAAPSRHESSSAIVQTSATEASQRNQNRDSAPYSAARAISPLPTAEEGDGGRSPKRRLVELDEVPRAAQVCEDSQQRKQFLLSTEQAESALPPAETQVTGEAQASTAPTTDTPIETLAHTKATSSALPAEAQATDQISTRRSKRQGTWAPINEQRVDAEDFVARSETRDGVDNDNQDDGSARFRASTRNARAQVNNEGIATTFDIEAPPKKPRKPRKDKGARRKKYKRTDTDGAESQENQDEADRPEVGENEATEEAAPAPKRRKVTRKRAANTAGDGTGLAVEVVLGRRRGRGRERKPTPPDAEDRVIDEGATFMNSLASRNTRTGKLSEREKQMREINWAEVKERRKREESSVINGRNKADVDERLNRAGEAMEEARNQNTGPKMRIREDGQIELIPESNVIDAQGDADIEIEAFEEVEEDDLTQRFNSKSFMRDSKRFPGEFLLPGQGTRWTSDATDAFYEALQTFGTDFMMISTMFPGITRRSIKTKFNREERDNPARLKAALSAQRNSNWQSYLTKSIIAEADFKDPRAIEEELRLEREAMQVDIDAEKLKADEIKRQKILAGIIDPDDEKEAADKENGEDGGRKKRKKRDRTQPAKSATPFEPEPGMQILGTVEDGDGWDD